MRSKCPLKLRYRAEQVSAKLSQAQRGGSEKLPQAQAGAQEAPIGSSGKLPEAPRLSSKGSEKRTNKRSKRPLNVRRKAERVSGKAQGWSGESVR